MTMFRIITVIIGANLQYSGYGDSADEQFVSCLGLKKCVTLYGLGSDSHDI